MSYSKYNFQFFLILSNSRFESLCLMSSRLSYFFLPRANAISNFAKPRSLINIRVAMMVNPLSWDFRSNFLSSLRVSKSLRSRFGVWLLQVPNIYSVTCMFITHNSLLRKTQCASAIFAFPSRIYFISVPNNCIPATYFSRKAYSNDAFLFLILMLDFNL